MVSRGPQINHLSFYDDIFIFTSSIRISLQLVCKTIMAYERESDQQVNKEKGYFIFTNNNKEDLIDIIKD